MGQVVPGVELRLADDKTLTLTVSPRGQDRNDNRYASSDSAAGIFTLTGDAASRLGKTINDFKPGGAPPPGGEDVRD